MDTKQPGLNKLDVREVSIQVCSYVHSIPLVCKDVWEAVCHLLELSVTSAFLSLQRKDGEYCGCHPSTHEGSFYSFPAWLSVLLTKNPVNLPYSIFWYLYIVGGLWDCPTIYSFFHLSAITLLRGSTFISIPPETKSQKQQNCFSFWKSHLSCSLLNSHSYYSVLGCSNSLWIVYIVSFRFLDLVKRARF